MSGFEPKIICFLCNWCSYAAADSAGSNRKIVPSGIRIIRVPCSGRVEPDLILKSFREGADGVLVCGCHPGDCHYVEGNYKAARRMHLMKTMLGQFGIEPERFRLEWVSAAEGDRFVEVATGMFEAVKKAGPVKLQTEAMLAKGGA
ncbi:MAG: hydrogenase iron-sulfur subunit [bacterium]